MIKIISPKRYILSFPFLRIIGGFLLIFLLMGCGDLFDTHPYAVKVSDERDINVKQIARIERQCADLDTLRVAFISDTHLWQSQARDEIEDINRRADIDFVVHCGDLTDTGTNKEYKWAGDILSNLLHPYVVLIGNHDFLGSGDYTYNILYGPMNFSFIAARVKFVCVNTNMLESPPKGSLPDIAFMENASTSELEQFDRTIVVMHVAPYTDQFDDEDACIVFRQQLSRFPNLLCCFHGHEHKGKNWHPYNDDLTFYGVSCAKHRSYCILTITPDDYEVEYIHY